MVIALSSGAALNGSPLSGGYAGPKATIRFLARYAAAESEREALGIRFISVLPQLTLAIDLGSTAVTAYAARQGEDVATFLEKAGPVLTPEQVGRSIAELATGSGHDRDAYLLRAAGLAPVAWGVTTVSLRHGDPNRMTLPSGSTCEPRAVRKGSARWVGLAGDAGPPFFVQGVGVAYVKICGSRAEHETGRVTAEDLGEGLGVGVPVAGEGHGLRARSAAARSRAEGAVFHTEDPGRAEQPGVLRGEEARHPGDTPESAPYRGSRPGPGGPFSGNQDAMPGLTPAATASGCAWSGSGNRIA